MSKLQKISVIALALIGILFLASFDKSETKTEVPDRTLPYKHYRIIWGNYASELESNINYYLKDGWEPVGGVVVEQNGFYQAIAK